MGRKMVWSNTAELYLRSLNWRGGRRQRRHTNPLPPESPTARSSGVFATPRCLFAGVGFESAPDRCRTARPPAVRRIGSPLCPQPAILGHFEAFSNNQRIEIVCHGKRLPPQFDRETRSESYRS